jgi:hypothetical protein
MPRRVSESKAQRLTASRVDEACVCARLRLAAAPPDRDLKRTSLFRKLRVSRKHADP